MTRPAFCVDISNAGEGGAVWIAGRVGVGDKNSVGVEEGDSVGVGV